MSYPKGSRQSCYLRRLLQPPGRVASQWRAGIVNYPGACPASPQERRYGFLRAVLDCLSDYAEGLAEELDSPHRRGGNTGYQAQQMLRLHLLRYLLNERYANRFLNRMGNDPRLLELCGMSSVPSERAFSDFKNHKLAPRQEELDWIFAAVIEDCADLIEELKESGDIPADAPALGEILAVDATDFPAHARPTPGTAGSTATLRVRKTAR